MHVCYVKDDIAATILVSYLHMVEVTVKTKSHKILTGNIAFPNKHNRHIPVHIIQCNAIISIAPFPGSVKE